MNLEFNMLIAIVAKISQWIYVSKRQGYHHPVECGDTVNMI